MQATIALDSGNSQAAVNLANEASYAAYAYEDYDVVGAALELGHQAFMAGGGEGVYAPLNMAAQWANRVGLDHLAASFLIAEAEELAAAGESKLAVGRLGSISGRRRDLRLGRLAPPRRYVEAFIAYAEGNGPLGDKATAEALALARPQSLRNFQISLASRRVDSGQASSRIAVELYATLLRDPTSDDWARRPLETLTDLTTPHESAFGRWMVAALSREEIMSAISVTDMVKRRRFWLAQPAGGRAIAIRHLLESDPSRLPPAAAVERRNLLARIPQYAQLVQQAAELEAELLAKPLANDSGGIVQERYSDLKRLANNAEKREALVRQLLLRRDATDMIVPPARTSDEVQAQLQPGQVVVVYHESGTSTFGFIMTQDAYHHWQLPEEGPLREAVGGALRNMGNYNPRRTRNVDELAIESWQPDAGQLGDILLGASRLDLANTGELIVIPDGVLWHVPFEALVPSQGGNTKMVIDSTPVRYVPTLGYATADRFAPSPIRTTVVAAPRESSSSDYLAAQVIEEIKDTVTGPEVIDNPVAVDSSLLPRLTQQLVVLAESELDPKQPYAFRPLPLDRSSSGGGLAQWLSLPLPGCERLVLGGVHTAAEHGFTQQGRDRKQQTQVAPGIELFHASCGLLASGAKTVLISRWPTAGKTHRDLLREFLLELPHLPADQAWRRSVALARGTELDPDQEPRYERPKEGTPSPTADHPFMWAGYLLVDTGYDPSPPPEDDSR